MSSLTDEQRRRIEENRRKALEKRAAALKNKNDFSATSTSVSSSNGPKLSASASISNVPKLSTSASTSNGPKLAASANTFNGSKIAASNSSNFNVSKIAPIFIKNKNNEKNNNFKSNSKFGPFKPNDTKSFYKAQSSSSGDNQKRHSGKVINGTSVLLNKQRFLVNMPYHAQAIEVFKTMPTRQYDTNSRKWNFDLSDHIRLQEAMKALRPEVCVGFLPTFVLQAIKRSSNYPSPSTIDLMCLDPLLLEAFMPFQREGVCFGVSRNGRVLIADDMGLGKTIQALGIASYYKNEWPVLIVAPSSVRYSWADAIEQWISTVVPEDISVVNTGKDPCDGTFVIVSYDILSRRIEELKNLNFKIVIMDESHMLKNFKSIRYKSASVVMKKAKRVILLSGTPALSRPSELYTQLSAIDYGLFPNFQDFGIRYCDGKQQSWGWDFSGFSNMEELNVILESTFMIRRLKSDVICQLPSKQRMTIMLDPSSVKESEKRMKEAAKHLNEPGLKGIEKHGALLQFFSESAFAKADAASDYVKELLIEGNKKFLVFAHHRVMLDKISDVCEKQKTRYIRIDGTTASESRQRLVDHFQTEPDIRVAVLSITAASTGITLTAAQLVVFAELYWNPGFLVQAEDRVHRIGQQDSVLVQYLVAKGTADDVIWPLIQSKLNILNKVGLSKDSFSSASTTNQKVKGMKSINSYFSEIKEEDLLELADVELNESSEEPASKKIKLADAL